MEETIKAELPNFVKVKSIAYDKEGQLKELAARMNPYHITSYAETVISNNNHDNTKNVVVFYIAGVSYFVDMTIEEADRMMEDIDRSLSFKENT